MDLSRVAWRKSTYSGGNGGNCVEVGGHARRPVALRDSKNPAAPALALTSRSWSTLTGQIKSGTFDL